MQTRVPQPLRAIALAGALLGAASAAVAAQVQQGSNEPITAAVLGNSSDADTVRITHTADGQLFLRLYGSQSAMLLIDEAAGKAFVASARVYFDKASKGCTGDESFPRLTSQRVHRTGVNGIAIRCSAAPDGSATFTALVTRPSGEDGPGLEAMAITTSQNAVRAFVRDIERLMAAPNR